MGKSRIFRILSLRLVIISALMMLCSSSSVQDVPKNLADYRTLWNAQGVEYYRMELETILFPQPPVGLELVVRENEIVNSTIIACDNPSEAYPARLCEPIRRYYSWVGRFTIDELFDMADVCIQETRVWFSTCPLFADTEFHDYTDFGALVGTARECLTALPQDGNYVSLCAVSFNSDYGYPNAISRFNPGLIHPSFISVNEFQPIS